MYKMKQKVFKVLKTEASKFGFNRNELMSVAASIADNLNLDEDASEEDVDEAITKSVKSYLPFLEISQSLASRVIEKNRKKNDDDDDVDVDENIKTSKSAKPKSNEEDDSQMPKWAEGFMKSFEALSAKVTAMEGQKLSDNRRTRLETLLKGSGSFGALTLKNFAKMKFDDDSEFEDFYSEVEESLKEFAQSKANEKLDKTTKPGAGKSGEHDKPEVLTDEELTKLADQF